ncbi:hypothetical protein BCR43DRAFT_160249 [Syncephalastrum racemosum]|uniref:BHLH domain-containing protein n=1 Tax=Syncephalastrum racemosum TaxID=13706 RepID=A0A1X2HNM6_SYNRA|nr:hypothetical protein BCR43DRAFT_160249 [Syncephalastrum racemosum]
MLDSPMAAATAGMASPSKKQQSKAERRAEHNAIERARRESLNSKFQQLAHALPNLQNDRRPSKGTIIERTLEYVKNTTQKDERYKHHIRQLRKENQMLRKQLKHEREMEARCQSSCSSIKSDIDDASFASMTPTPTDTTSGMYHLQHAPSQQHQSPAEVFSMGSGTSPYYEDPSDDDYSAHGDTDPIDVANAICPPVSFSQQYTNMVYMGDYMKAPVSMPPLSSDYHEVKIDMPRQQQ